MSFYGKISFFFRGMFWIYKAILQRDTFKCKVLINHLYSWIVNGILKCFEPFWQNNLEICCWALIQKVLMAKFYYFPVECFEYIKQSYKDTFKCKVLIHHLYSWIVNGILKSFVEPFWHKTDKLVDEPLWQIPDDIDLFHSLCPLAWFYRNEPRFIDDPWFE